MTEKCEMLLRAEDSIISLVDSILQPAETFDCRVSIGNVLCECSLKYPSPSLWRDFFYRGSQDPRLQFLSIKELHNVSKKIWRSPAIRQSAKRHIGAFIWLFDAIAVTYRIDQSEVDAKSVSDEAKLLIMAIFWERLRPMIEKFLNHS